MRVKRVMRKLIALVLLVCFFITGCVSSTPHRYETCPEKPALPQDIKVVAVAKPQIKMFEIPAGGIPELRDDWSDQAAQNVTKSIFSRYSGASIRYRPLATNENTEDELQEVIALFETVIDNGAIPNETECTDPCCDNSDNFGSVGSIENLLAESKADALLLVSGTDRFATVGNKALKVAGTISMVAISVATGATGAAVTPNANFPNAIERGTVRMAIIDRNGKMLWVEQFRPPDLRKEKKCKKLIDSTLPEPPDNIRK